MRTEQRASTRHPVYEAEFTLQVRAADTHGYVFRGEEKRRCVFASRPSSTKRDGWGLREVARRR